MTQTPVPSASGGIVIRIVHRAQTRLVEWLAAFQMMFMGLVLFHPSDTFSNSPNFQVFRETASEDTWAVFLFMVGFVRLGGLLVNGSRQDITPTIRALGAFVGFFIFFGMFFGFTATVIVANTAPPIILAMLGPSAVAELAAIVYSVRDAKAYRDGQRNS